jgi:hypothetical protein
LAHMSGAAARFDINTKTLPGGTPGTPEHTIE